jgi:hypothetical protein
LKKEKISPLHTHTHTFFLFFSGKHGGETFYYHDDGSSTSWEFPDWIPHGWIPPENDDVVHTSSFPPKRNGKHNRTVTTHVIDNNGHDWVVAEADIGQRYFFNQETGESTWERPLGESIRENIDDDENIAVALNKNDSMQVNPMRR